MNAPTLTDRAGIPITVGARLGFSFPSNLQTVSFSAKVVQLDGAYIWVEIPSRVRTMQWSPYAKRSCKFLASQCQVRTTS